MVERYNCYGSDIRGGEMRPEQDGQWVRHADYAALEAENARLRADMDGATVYARNLLTAFVGEHFPDNDRWKPLDDLIGMLTQFDNASTIARDYKLRLSTLEATPPAPKVTEEMVKAAAASLRPDLFTQLNTDELRSDDYAWTRREDAKVKVLHKARVALTAAQEAGKP